MQIISLVDAFPQKTLTGDQTSAVTMLSNFLGNKEKDVFLLCGYAGTGKTFLMKGLVEYLMATKRSFVLAAPTGKAAVTLSNMTGEAASTIHRMIYNLNDFREYSQDVEGSQTYKFYANIRLNTYPANTVYIIDEASMIADIYQEGEFFRYGTGFVLNDLIKFIYFDNNDNNKKIIFIGDNAQLPPVGMKFSPALNLIYLQDKYGLRVEATTLTDVVRQKQDRGILKNANHIRSYIDKNIFNKLTIDFETNDVKQVDYKYLLSIYEKVNKSGDSQENIIVTRTNSDADAYNQEVRKLIFPGCDYKLRVGDKIICSNNSLKYGNYISNGSLGFVERIIGNTEEHRVKLRKKNSITGKIDEKIITLSFIKALLKFENSEGRDVNFVTYIFENYLYHTQRETAIEEQKGLYIDFCQRNSSLKAGTQPFKDALLSDPYFNSMRINYGYAITCHKAQGSAWKNVFVLCRGKRSDLNKDYFRWIYTAMTRASENLYLIEPPNFTLLGGLKSIDLALSSVACAEESIKPVINMDNKSNQHYAADNFGITDKDSIFFNIFTKVSQIILGKDISIDHIEHHQYQETYFFSYNKEYAQINIYYGTNGKIKKLIPVKLNTLTKWLLDILKTLVDLDISSPKNQNIEFSESFLKEFHDEICQLLSNYSIEFVKLETLQWCQRYTFRKNSKIVKIDFWYNSKKQFKKHNKTPGFNSDVLLLQEINTILNIQG